MNEVNASRNGHVDVFEDSVHIYDEHGEEIVMWLEDEWIEDPSVTISIANAIRVFYVDGPDALKSIIGRR